MKHRILVIGHGHPDFHCGGGEIAAHNCWQGYVANPDVEDAWFLARGKIGHDNGQATGRMTRYRDQQYLWDQGLSDPFMMQARNQHEVTGYFADLVARLKPTIVHSHHYFLLGLEYLKALKNVDSSIRTVLTLHEYMAICPNSGLMLNPKTGQLSQSGEYDRHLESAKGRSIEDLWLRKNRFDHYFSYVDHFVAPSQFLKDRYVEWGISAERISVLRNGQPSCERLPIRKLNGDTSRNRFAFFGQINPYKGVDVILRGLAGLPKPKRKSLRFEIHGANLEVQSEAFQETFAEISKPLIAEGVVQFRGPYSREELPLRMANVDWVMVPSIWYENAPLVIDEAFGLGRPVLTTAIGGMKEAVTDGVDGFCLPRGDGASWAEAMVSLSKDTGIYEKCVQNIKAPVSLADSVNQHLALFEQVSGQPA